MNPINRSIKLTAITFTEEMPIAIAENAENTSFIPRLPGVKLKKSEKLENTARNM